MHVGLVMECDYREGRTHEEAFAEAMSIAEIAETQGLDGVWLAERHFAMHRRPTDPMGAGIPSIAAVPLVLAAAIAARTTRVRIGTGVSVLPLCHPIRTAEEATTHDTFPMVGRMGFSLVTGLRGFDVPEAAGHLKVYRTALREAGHPGNGNVYLRIPVYVAGTAALARAEPEESTTRAYRRLAENLAASVGAAGTTGSEERAERADRLSHVSYDDLLRDRVAYGTPDMVVDRLRQLREELGLSGVIMESNVGGRIPLERVLTSIRLYAQEVAPRLR